MSFDKLILDNLKKHKVLAIIAVFVSFFVVVGLLNYFQRVTLEGFVTLNKMEHFTGHGNGHNNKKKENFNNKERFMKAQRDNFANRRGPRGRGTKRST